MVDVNLALRKQNTLQLNLSMATTLLSPETQQEATVGRFFNTSSPERFYAFSQNYWIVNGDTLPMNFGYLLQAGISQTGELKNLALPMKEKTWDSTLSLSFDARCHQANEFIWQLTKAEEYGERFVATVHARPTSWLAKLAVRSTNGSIVRAGYASQPNLEGIGAEIQFLTGDEIVRGSIERHRAHRRSIHRDLSKFVVTGLKSVGRNRYEKELKEKEMAVDNIGFLALEPQYISD